MTAAGCSSSLRRTRVLRFAVTSPKLPTFRRSDGSQAGRDGQYHENAASLGPPVRRTCMKPHFDRLLLEPIAAGRYGSTRGNSNSGTSSIAQ